MNIDNWLKELKVGDEVHHVRTYDMFGKVAIVERITKTMIICSSGRYSKKDGYAVGCSDSWEVSRIKPLTEDARQDIYRESVLKAVSGYPYQTVPTFKLIQIMNILKEGA